MNKNRFHNPAYRMLVALLSVSLLIGPGAGPAYAAQTALGDIPIASKVTAKPNIVYTLDDSGSMQFNYLPDWVIAAQGAAVSISKITRVGPTATATVVSTAALADGPVRHDLRPAPTRVRRQLSDHGYQPHDLHLSGHRRADHPGDRGAVLLHGRHRVLPQRQQCHGMHGEQRELQHHVPVAAVLRGGLQSPRL